MDIMTVVPGAVISLAIAMTELYKKLVPEEIIKKTIWIPPLVIGVIGAVCLGYGVKPVMQIIWDGLTYAGVACYVVLIQKRTAA